MQQISTFVTGLALVIFFLKENTDNSPLGIPHVKRA